MRKKFSFLTPLLHVRNSRRAIDVQRLVYVLRILDMTVVKP